MRNGPDIAATAALIGDPARAAILSALMDGQALTATELASEGGVTPQTASVHLAKLEQGRLLMRARQGQHCYFRLASPDVAHVLKALMSLSHGTGSQRTRPGPKDAALREARVCYNHLAGRRGVQMYESLSRRGALTPRIGDDGGIGAFGARPGTADWTLTAVPRLPRLVGTSVASGRAPWKSDPVFDGGADLDCTRCEQPGN